MGENFPAGLAWFGPGSVVAGYRLETVVGTGGMAVVFQARDERLGRLVALKVLTPLLAADGAFRRRYLAHAPGQLPGRGPAALADIASVHLRVGSVRLPGQTCIAARDLDDKLAAISADARSGQEW